MAKETHYGIETVPGAGSFRNTSSGSIEYRFSYTNEDGISKRKSITGDSIETCIGRTEKFMQRMELARNGKDPDKSISEILREEYFKDYEMGYVKEQGYCRNISNLRILEKHRIAWMPIRAVTKADVRSYFLTLSKYSESMVNKFYTQIKLAFSLAEMDNIIEDNIMKHRDMKCPKLGRPERKISALTPEQQKLFVDYIENKAPKGCNDYRLQLMIELYSGMRMGEINALRKEDIDFCQNVIRVIRTVSRGLDYRDFISDTTKTETGQREVPISKNLKPYLQEALTRQRSNRENLLFFDYRKNSIISTSQVNNYYRRICEAIGILAQGQHALRHTFATRCIEAGIPPVVLKNWLGHTNIHITLDTYTDVFSGMNNKAVEKLDKYLDSL